MACEHPWDLHPGVNPWLNVCGLCVAEEDHGQRRYEDMCTLQPEAAAGPLPVGRLQPRVTRRLSGRYQVHIEDWQRQRWATLTPTTNTRVAAEELKATVDADLATLPLYELRRKYIGTGNG